MTSIAEQNTLALSSDPEYLDQAQQIVDATGQEPCVISPDCENTGPNGVCKGCREHFVRYFKNRATYERIAFGFTADERESYDRAADLIFGKVAPLALDEKIKRLVPGGDPELTALAHRMYQMLDPDLLQTIAAHKSEKDKIEAQAREMVEEYARPHTLHVQIGQAIALERILERRGKKIPSAQYKCEVTAAKEIDKRMDVLLQLLDVLDADVLKDAQALWISGVDASEVVKDPDKLKALLDLGCKPVYSAHAGNLRKLARDCGGEVAQIVDAGCVDTYKTPQLVFEILPGKEKNVTPKAVA